MDRIEQESSGMTGREKKWERVQKNILKVDTEKENIKMVNKINTAFL